MKAPVLHIMSGDKWLCGLREDGSNWPEKYMDDEVARFLEFCEGCEVEYIKKYDKEAFIDKRNHMRRDMSNENSMCGCGNHPEQTLNKRKVIPMDVPTTKQVAVMTLRMYLDT
tara:strand:+ start:62 stop:400 length:339 start_codon:yes stop_codon:yes gene_type:complete